MYYFATK